MQTICNRKYCIYDKLNLVIRTEVIFGLFMVFASVNFGTVFFFYNYEINIYRKKNFSSIILHTEHKISVKPTYFLCFLLEDQIRNQIFVAIILLAKHSAQILFYQGSATKSTTSNNCQNKKKNRYLRL